jgi:hypothetical protein
MPMLQHLAPLKQKHVRPLSSFVTFATSPQISLDKDVMVLFITAIFNQNGPGLRNVIFVGDQSFLHPKKKLLCSDPDVMA